MIIRNSEFSIADRDVNYFIALISRLREYCRWIAIDLVRSNSKSIRCNKIDFEKSNMKGFGIPREEELIEFPFELNLTANEHGRIHGFFLGDVYHIVWLDPKHNLFS